MNYTLYRLKTQVLLGLLSVTLATSPAVTSLHCHNSVPVNSLFMFQITMGEKGETPVHPRRLPPLRGNLVCKLSTFLDNDLFKLNYSEFQATELGTIYRSEMHVLLGLLSVTLASDHFSSCHNSLQSCCQEGFRL